MPTFHKKDKVAHGRPASWLTVVHPDTQQLGQDLSRQRLLSPHANRRLS